MDPISIIIGIAMNIYTLDNIYFKRYIVKNLILKYVLYNYINSVSYKV